MCRTEAWSWDYELADALLLKKDDDKDDDDAKGLNYKQGTSHVYTTHYTSHANTSTNPHYPLHSSELVACANLIHFCKSKQKFHFPSKSWNYTTTIGNSCELGWAWGPKGASFWLVALTSTRWSLPMPLLWEMLWALIPMANASVIHPVSLTKGKNRSCGSW